MRAYDEQNAYFFFFSEAGKLGLKHHAAVHARGIVRLTATVYFATNPQKNFFGYFCKFHIKGADLALILLQKLNGAGDTALYGVLRGPPQGAQFFGRQNGACSGGIPGSLNTIWQLETELCMAHRGHQQG